MQLIIFIVNFTFCLLASAISFAEQPHFTLAEQNWISQHEYITISGPQAFPPFQYVDKDGVFKGMASEYVHSIAKIAGLKIKTVQGIPWSEIIEKVKAKEIDVLTCAAKTPEREEFLSFLSPHMSFPLVIITRNNAPFISGLDGLHKKKIALTKKISTYDWLVNDNIDFTPHFVPSLDDALREVSLGNADAAIQNLAAASYIIDRDGLLNLKIAAPTPYGNYQLSIAVRNDQPELASILQKSLNMLSRERHNEIRQNWISLRYEYGITYKDVIKWLSVVGGLSAFLLGIFYFWNRRLAKEISERKKVEREKEKLTEELHESQFKAERESLKVKAMSQGKLASLGQIATGVAHEINQPLTFIKITFDSILRDLQKGEFDLKELKEDSLCSLEQIDRITKIIDHLRAFGRDDFIEFELVSLEEIFKNTLILMGQRIKLKNIVFQYDFDGKSPDVFGNAYKLEQVFINLIQNSMDALANRKDGKIQISIYAKSTTHVTLLYRDNGDGISPKIEDKIFEPFFTTKPVGQGTGLGLSIVYGIIKEHDGNIEYVKNEQGADFLITLPIQDLSKGKSLQDK